MSAITYAPRNITPRVAADVLTEGACAYCGFAVVDALVVDHVYPVSRGGSDERENLTAACARCNLEKSDLTVDEWSELRIGFGKPWPPPNPGDTVLRLAEAVILRGIPDRPLTAAEARETHAAVMRAREAHFDIEAEADRIAALLRPSGSGGRAA